MIFIANLSTQLGLRFFCFLAIAFPQLSYALINAQDAPLHSLEAQYTVKVGTYKKYGDKFMSLGNCSGALFFNQRMIITAAHCFDFNYDLVQIEFGTGVNDPNHLTLYSNKVAIHPKYKALKEKHQTGKIQTLQSVNLYARTDKDITSQDSPSSTSSLLFGTINPAAEPPNMDMIPQELRDQYQQFKKYYDMNQPHVFSREQREAYILYDMAIVFLDNDVDSTKYLPLQLASAELVDQLSYKDEVFLSGFGLRNFYESSSSKTLASSPLVLARKRTFQGVQAGLVTFGFNQIFPCQGDSGGPLVVHTETGIPLLVGITSANLIESQCIDGTFYSSPLFLYDWLQEALY